MRNSALIFACVAVLALPLNLPAQSRSKPRSVRSLKGSLSEIQKRRRAVASQLSHTRRAVRKVKGDLAEVNHRIDKVQVALEETTDKLVAGRSRQKSLGERLNVSTKDLAETREKVRQRLRWYYVHGQESHLALLVGSKSTGELASWKDLMERVSAKDREVFATFKALRNEVADKKGKQDRLVVAIKGLADTQKKQESQLHSVREEKVEVLGDLRNRQAQLQKVLRQLAADEAAIESQIEAYLRAQRASGRSTGPAPKGKFTRPCSGRISSSYGMRFHPILRTRKLHAGVDFAAPSGSPIYAANSGIVVASQRMRGYGNVVIVDHGGGLTTTYAHCSRIFVGRGAKVGRGQRIASVGATGLATGPHLHFEVRINGKTVNPMRYL
jgi:murein DD-endopeptidase MepM/ murein hydrolase activator NlpD